jgi:hypothetical protein
MRIRVRDPATHQLKVNPDGTPYCVPFDTMTARQNSKVTNLVPEARPVGEIKHLSNMKKNIEKVLNQDGYNLAIRNCPKSASCACQVKMKFEIEFVTSDRERHHARVELFSQAKRADSGHWGEENIERQRSEAGYAYAPISPDRDQAHETGHLFSFPDEYYDQGGAVHRDYIDTTQHVDIKLAKANAERDKWQGRATRNLMGTGVYDEGNGKTPSYYVYRFRDWFEKATGRDWAVIPHKEAL